MAAVPGLAQITCEITGVAGTGPDFNIFHVQDVGAVPDVGHITDAVTALTTFYNAIKTFYPTGLTITVGQKVVNLASDPGVILPITPQTVAAGGASTGLPPQCAALISWQSNVASRSGRGRTYIGPVSTTAGGGDGLIPTTYVTMLQNAATTLVGGSTNWALVVANRNKEGELTHCTEVTRAIARPHLYTQRRRGF